MSVRPSFRYYFRKNFDSSLENHYGHVLIHCTFIRILLPARACFLTGPLYHPPLETPPKFNAIPPFLLRLTDAILDFWEARHREEGALMDLLNILRSMDRMDAAACLERHIGSWL